MFDVIELAAVFVTGGVSGVFAMVLIGIHSEEHNMSLTGSARPHTGATRRMLGIHFLDATEPADDHAAVR